jgi:hypothetical protein
MAKRRVIWDAVHEDMPGDQTTAVREEVGEFDDPQSEEGQRCFKAFRDSRGLGVEEFQIRYKVSYRIIKS